MTERTNTSDSPAPEAGARIHQFALYGASLQRAGSSTDAIQTAVRGAESLLGVDAAAYFEWQTVGAGLILRGRHGIAGDVALPVHLRREEVLPPNYGPACDLVILPDFRQAEWSGASPFVQRLGYTHGMLVGVACAGARHGLLAVLARTPRTFGEVETQLLRDVGGLLGAALERLQGAVASEESTTRLEGIVASAMDAIISVDETQRIVLFNHAAEKVFRCTAADVLGAPLERLIPARLRDAHRSHVQRFGASGTTERRMGLLQPLAGLRADGEEFPLEASISQAEVGGRRVFTVILRDITERRRLEEQVLHAQRLDSIGHLAGGIAHDFNNALTVILGYLELLLPHQNAVRPMRECIHGIEQAARRAADLTSKLLAFARKQMIQPQKTDLNQLVGGIAATAGRLLGDDVEVIVHAAPLLPSVLIDPVQFEQVLINLAVNARDAMPRGGKFIMETSRIQIGPEQVPLRPSLAAGIYVQLTVSDTGKGMDPVTLEHCFEPFFTTKEVGRGTGLGLATCHGIVKQAGGDISAYSELGRGVTFRIYLPAYDDANSPAVANGPLPATRSGTETILLVEDDALIRGLAVRALREGGYEVVEAADAGEAMVRAEQLHGNIDLLLTDVMLPKASGAELATQLRQPYPQMRVLYTSGFAPDVIADHGVLAASTAFLPKPYTPSALLAKTRQVLDGAVDLHAS